MGCRCTPVPMQLAQHHRPLARQLGHLQGRQAGRASVGGVTKQGQRVGALGSMHCFGTPQSPAWTPANQPTCLVPQRSVCHKSQQE